MGRFVVLFVLGAFAGGAGVVALDRLRASDLVDSGDAGPSSASAEAAVVAADPQSRSLPASDFASQRLAIIEQIAAIDSRVDIEALIRELAGQPASRLRDLELEALLAHYSAIDPASAAQLARGLALGSRFLNPLFASWARSDADAAIVALAGIEPAARQRELALAVLAAIGIDEAGIARVAVALPELDRIGFESDATVERARADPVGVLTELLIRGPGNIQGITLPRVVDIAAQLDPRGALAAIETSANSLQSISIAGLIAAEWARSEPDAVFAWLESRNPASVPESTELYATLAEYDADRLLAMIEAYPPALRATAQQGAVRVLAQTDPESAIALLESVPAGQTYDQLLRTIGETYAASNPDAALAWSASLQPPSPEVHANVLSGIVSVDPDRGLDLLFAAYKEAAAEAGGGPIMPPAASPYRTALMSIALTADIPPASVLSRMAALNDVTMTSLSSTVLSNWARADIDAALNWALDNPDDVQLPSYRSLARELAAVDPARAIGGMVQVPEAQRSIWFEGVAAGLAGTDIDAAVNLLSRNRGQVGYPQAYAAVVAELASSDPETAARMYSERPPEVEENLLVSASMTLARTWAQSDPLSAAAWAAGSDATAPQRAMLERITQDWAQADDAEALRWIQRQAPGPTRDMALNGYLAAASARGEFDPTLIDVYSSREQGEAAAGRAIALLGRTNLDEAHRLLDLYITDENVRRQTEEQLARTGGTGGNTILTTLGLIGL